MKTNKSTLGEILQSVILLALSLTTTTSLSTIEGQESICSKKDVASLLNNPTSDHQTPPKNTRKLATTNNPTTKRSPDAFLVELLERFGNPQLLNNKSTFKIPKVCSGMWENPDSSRCSRDKWQSISLNWELLKFKTGPSFNLHAAYMLGNQSEIVYKLTYEWVSTFDAKSNLILSLNQSSLICELAAYKWLDQSKDLKSSSFFYSRYLPAAKSCTSFLGQIRGAFMCMLCDKSVNNQTCFESKEFGKYISSGNLFLREKSCTYFISECLDYIEYKDKIYQLLNLQYSLSLCDKTGKYVAYGPRTSWKKVMPTMTSLDSENLETCKKGVQSVIPSIEDSSLIEQNKKACSYMCNNYFSLDLMVKNDVAQYDNFVYMYHVLSKILNGTVTEHSFARSPILLRNHPLMFFNKLKFFFNYSGFLGQDKQTKQMFENRIPISLFEKYASFSSMNDFPTSKFVKSGFLASVSGLWFLGLIWLRMW